MKSRFGRHIVFWALIVPLLLVIVAPLVPQPALFTVSEAERRANRAALGAQAHAEVEQAAARRFDRWFVRPGAVAETFRIFANRQGAPVLGIDGAMETLSASWISNFWLGVHRAIYRLSVAGYWYFGMGTLVVAAFIDGMVRRKIKQHEFGYNNPVSFHLMTHVAILVVGLALVLPFGPFPVTQVAWPVLALVATLVSWKTAEHFQTGA